MPVETATPAIAATSNVDDDIDEIFAMRGDALHGEIARAQEAFTRLRRRRGIATRDYNALGRARVLLSAIASHLPVSASSG